MMKNKRKKTEVKRGGKIKPAKCRNGLAKRGRTKGIVMTTKPQEEALICLCWSGKTVGLTYGQ
jgi:hypothetical protein